MSQELYTRETVEQMLIDIANDIGSFPQPKEFLKNYDSVTEYVPISDPKLTCSTDGCDEVPFIALCLQHYNEVIEKNLSEEKVHEDHIMESAV